MHAPRALSDQTVHSHADPGSWIARSQRAYADGRHREGVELAEAAVRAARLAAEPRILAQALSEQASHRWRLGEFESAVRSAREAGEHWKDLGDPQECDTLCLLAISCSELGLHQEALKAATTAFDKARAGGFDVQIADALNRVGVCFDRLGDHVQSEKFLLQALGQARALNNDALALSAQNNLMATCISAFYHYRQRDELVLGTGALHRAREHGRLALALARRLGDDYRLAVTHGNLGEVLGLAGEHAAAHAALAETVERSRRHGYRAVELRSRHNIAEVLILEGRHDEAVDVLLPTLAELDGSDHETTRMRVHSALYRAFKARSDFERALHHCEAYHALELHRATQQTRAQARLMVNRLDVENALIDGERARMEARLQRLRSRELENDKRRLQARAEQLQRDTLEDELTRLANRRRVDADLPRLFARAGTCEQPLALALALVDVDHFKSVNDRFGHAVGDDVLRTLAQIFRAKTRPIDLVARMGGEEFLFGLGDTTPATAREACERLRAAVETHPWAQLAEGLSVTISLGLANIRATDTLQALLDRADASLYEAKRRGRNRLHETG